MSKADRDSERVAANNGDLYGGRTSGKAVRASVDWNRMLRRLAEKARREQEERERG